MSEHWSAIVLVSQASFKPQLVDLGPGVKIAHGGGAANVDARYRSFATRGGK